MLMLKKIFLLVLSALAIAAAVVSCSDSDTTDLYDVRVIGGEGSRVQIAPGDTVRIFTVYYGDSSFIRWESSDVEVFSPTESNTAFIMPTWNVTVTAKFKAKNNVQIINGAGNESGDGYYEAGETVNIDAGTNGDRVFYSWTSVPEVAFDDSSSAKTWFVMPDTDVRVTASWHDADVKFTWSKEAQPYIYKVSASNKDVNWWYENVYNRLKDTLPERFSRMPGASGGLFVPNGVYTNEAPDDISRKDVYYPMSEGSYTAICTVLDTSSNTPDTFDIVANYNIEHGEDGAVKHYEIGFNVDLLLSGNLIWKDKPDVLWFQTDIDEVLGGLEKSNAAKLRKTLKEGGVTYRVFRRAGK